MAQVTPVASATQINNTTSSTTTAIAKPTGVQDGDLLIAIFAINNNTFAVTTLAGWTLLDVITSTGTTRVFWKIASGEGSSYTWTHAALASNSVLIGGISAFRNTHQSSPLAIYSMLYDSTSHTTPTGTAITPTIAPQGLLLMMIAARDAQTSVSGYATANNNPTWTEEFDLNAANGAALMTLAAAYGGYDFITTTGAPSAVLANASTSHVWLLHISPAGFTFTPDVLAAGASLKLPSANEALSMPKLAATVAMPVPTVSTATPKWPTLPKTPDETWHSTPKS